MKPCCDPVHWERTQINTLKMMCHSWKLPHDPFPETGLRPSGTQNSKKVKRSNQIYLDILRNHLKNVQGVLKSNKKGKINLSYHNHRVSTNHMSLYPISTFKRLNQLILKTHEVTIDTVLSTTTSSTMAFFICYEGKHKMWNEAWIDPVVMPVELEPLPTKIISWSP
jgi:hypothetical protein